MLFLATDGFSDSFSDPENTVKDMCEKLRINEYGLPARENYAPSPGRPQARPASVFLYLFPCGRRASDSWVSANTGLAAGNIT
jgi:hypothetical protein